MGGWGLALLVFARVCSSGLEHNHRSHGQFRVLFLHAVDEAIYFAVLVATTVGYGDHKSLADDDGAMLFTTFYVLGGKRCMYRTKTRPLAILHRLLPHRAIPTIPYHTIPYHTIQYHAMPYHTIPYQTIPYHTIPYHTIP